MAWATPKMDWDTDDGIGTADLNRIETNINILKVGGDNGGSIASANSLAVTKNSHLITGNTDIMFISTTGWAAGARILLTFDEGSVVLHHNETSPPSGYAALYLTIDNGAHENYSAGPAGITFEFFYDGTYWRNIGTLYHS
jgi:hypothetical protein